MEKLSVPCSWTQRITELLFDSEKTTARVGRREFRSPRARPTKMTGVSRLVPLSRDRCSLPLRSLDTTNSLRRPLARMPLQDPQRLRRRAWVRLALWTHFVSSGPRPRCRRVARAPSESRELVQNPCPGTPDTSSTAERRLRRPTSEPRAPRGRRGTC